MRTSRWDRPPPPRDWRWVVGGIGRILIATGLLMFGFVAYQLWGTGLEYNQAQDRLADDFQQLVATPDGPDGPTTTGLAPTTSRVAVTPAVTSPPSTTAPASTVSPPTVPDFAAGDVMARLEITSIGVDDYVVSGVEPNDLKKGPGHYPDTPMPGQFGNAAIAGHRTTYGQPFFRLDELQPGDQIVLTTVQGRFVYVATGSEIVAPGQSDVVATTDPSVARLTLTTCHPKYTAANRLIVFADLDTAASAAPQPAVVQTDRTATSDTSPAVVAPATVPAATPAPATTAAGSTGAPAAGEVTTEVADAFAHGWFSDDAAFVDVALWGLAVSAVAIGAYLVSRRFRRDRVGALVGIVPFVVVLYFFFQNVNRLLPAAL